MSKIKVFGVFGATSPTGNEVIHLLEKKGYQVVAFSRSEKSELDPRCTWVNLSSASSLEKNQTIIASITHVISVAHIWSFNDILRPLTTCSLEKIVCISSTSIFTKKDSPSVDDIALVNKLEQGEITAQKICAEKNTDLTILRPTIIYGHGTDRNIAEIMRLIRRFHFFPLLGKAEGMRQPIHLEDVSSACVLAALSDQTKNKNYNITGSETLSYKKMIEKIFLAIGKKPVFVHVPVFVIKFLISAIKKIPKYKNWDVEMANRMNQDLVFDSQQAKNDFDFSPRGFVLKDRDVV